jgi:hypothetical protein
MPKNRDQLNVANKKGRFTQILQSSRLKKERERERERESERKRKKEREKER